MVWLQIRVFTLLVDHITNNSHDELGNTFIYMISLAKFIS